MSFLSGITSAVGAGADILGSVIGHNEMDKSLESIAKIWQDYLSGVKDIDLPSLQSMMLQLEKYQVAGKMTPAQQSKMDNIKTALADFKANPEGRAGQVAALSKLADVANEGFTAGDRAAVNEGVNRIGTAVKGERAANIANAYARGIGGSGLELASGLNAGQQDVNSAYDLALKQAALSAEAKRSAVSNMLTGYGNLRTQDTNEAMEPLKAQDEMNKLTASLNDNIGSGNANREQEANKMNFTNVQDIANKNTDVANKQQIYNKVDAPQKLFENKLLKQQTQLPAIQGMTGNESAIGKNNAALPIGIGQTVNKLAGATAGAMNTNALSTTGTPPAEEDWITRMHRVNGNTTTEY